MCLAVPGRIESIETESAFGPTGKVNFGGILKDVNLAYVPEATIGDYVIVHVGFALSRLDEAEARQTLEYFRQMGELAELADEGASGPTARAPAPEGGKGPAAELPAAR
ncbi:MAG: HypC/HybG/HupF family hydrogenase formation chaperone [Verrucomicrobia bacterium]|nr:HypC/HybG/HupF family hydrogenase formation chaperone [Verrucomicrobiota bacterium]